MLQKPKKTSREAGFVSQEFLAPIACGLIATAAVIPWLVKHKLNTVIILICIAWGLICLVGLIYKISDQKEQRRLDDEFRKQKREWLERWPRPVNVENRSFLGWKIEVDIEATRKLYPQGCKAASEGCGCLMCRNYQAQKLNLLPENIISFLEGIGIRPECESHIVCDDFGELREYEIEFDFIGRIVGWPKGRKTRMKGMTLEFIHWHMSTTRHKGCPGIRLTLHDVPWVIDTPKLDSVSFDVEVLDDRILHVVYGGVPEGFHARLAILQKSVRVKELASELTGSGEVDFDTSELKHGEYRLQMVIFEEDLRHRSFYTSFIVE